MEPIWTDVPCRNPTQSALPARGIVHWRWNHDEVYLKINGEMRYLCCAVDHECEVLGSLASKQRDKRDVQISEHEAAPYVQLTARRVHNHFNQDRHLLSRHDYYVQRSATEAGLRSLTAGGQVRPTAAMP
jgi:DDE domain